MARYARRPSGQRRPPGPWKNGPVPVVGLIGGIGSGKSLAASALAAKGATVLDADAIGHALLDQRPARDEVVARFGDDVLAPEPPEGGPRRVDREALGRIVFDEPTSLKALERILHPRMRKTFEKAINRVARRQEAPMVVLDAAILLEAGWDDLCDAVVFVEAPPAARLARLAASRGWSAEQLSKREQAQLPPARKRERADHVLPNDSTPDALEKRIESLWGRLTRRPAWQPSSDDREGPPPRGAPAAGDADRPGPRQRSPRPEAPRARPRGRRSR
ncbi:dephospho-CoA kinase [Tautonia plasticadhaerens]|uniref:Dephospho-CoA kinase n=1 Tax=Tautonia plasticadhaerens TaxID=2527974 RepID=A0A518GWY3_9BACT|nr:dephospho-CoA kinase [Tautonia plasticadhaerens]QDV33099.1 Dephospho-CoA kinase [Tautonia plasticadhaerens]